MADLGQRGEIMKRELSFTLPCGEVMHAYRGPYTNVWRIQGNHRGEPIYIRLTDENAEAIIGMITKLAHNTPRSQMGPVYVSGVTVRQRARVSLTEKEKSE
jgi:hypothetical protein